MLPKLLISNRSFGSISHDYSKEIPGNTNLVVVRGNE